MPTASELSISALTLSLGPDDYEEQRLIESIREILVKAEQTREQTLAFAKSSKTTKPAEMTTLQSLIDRLGYDPRNGRPTRKRGRPRPAAIPDPLPPRGAVLTSCLGETYTVLGYAKWARKVGLGFDVILYEDANGTVIARGVAHMFAGTLASNVPFVTWPDDPRGYKPEQPVPLGKRRNLSQRDLKEDRLAQDADYQQDLAARKSGRRY